VMQVDDELCTACGACLKACPVGAVTENVLHYQIDAESCTACGSCREACHFEAIQTLSRKRAGMEKACM
jgi:NADH-quinone oxidoreductase subunit F